MKRTWMIAGLAGLALAGGLAVAGAQNAPDASVEVEQATARFTIGNMTCATCPIAVRKAMMRVEGVKSVDIDYAARTALRTVEHAASGIS